MSVSFSPGAVLEQVGGRFTYRLTVTNSGSTTLTNLEIHQIVPAELNVTGVPILDEVDYTQLGRIGVVNEDILWGINSLPAGRSITLSWFAQVDRPGDYRATGTVDVTADRLSRRFTPPPIYIASTTYGGVSGGKESVTRTVTQTRQVTGPGSAGAVGAPLPATGISTEGGFVVLAVVLILAGIALVRARGRRSAVHAMVALTLLLTACTSGGGDEIEPEVKGNRIENTDPGDSPDQTDQTDQTDGGSEEKGSDPQPEDPQVEAPEVNVPNVPATVGTLPVQFVTEEVLVQIPVSELPTRRLGPTGSDNEVSVDWSSGIQSAHSSLFFDPTSIATLRTVLAPSGDQMVVKVTIENLMSDEQLAIDGRIVHHIAGLPGGMVKLSSGPVDIVLPPGGMTKQSFSYKLPTGSYTLDSAFVPSV